MATGAIANIRLGQNRRLYVSATRESTFGTPATLTHVLDHPAEFSRLEVTMDRLLNDRYASGASNDFPSAHLPIGYRLKGDASVWASLEAIGIFFAKAMGNAGSGGDSKSGTGPYAHSITMATLPFFMEGMTIQENCAGVTVDDEYDTLFSGVNVDSAEFRVGATGYGLVSVGLVGSGKSQDGTTQTESGLTKPSYYIAAPKVRVSIEAASSSGVSPWDGGHEVGATAGNFPSLDSGAVNVSNYVESLSVKISNGATQDRSAGTSTSAGVYAGEAFTGAREVIVELTAHLGDSTKSLMRSLVESTVAQQREYAIYVDVAGGTDGHGAQFVVPLASIDENPSGGSGVGPQMYTFRFRGRKSSSYQPLSLYVVNADNYDYC